MNFFKSPRKSLSDLDIDASARLIAAASDIALILDGHGVIRDYAFADRELGDELERGHGHSWIGVAWNDLVAPDSRPKTRMLLDEAAAKRVSTARELNHPTAQGGGTIPILYSAIQVKPDLVVAVGRDLRAIANLQQRLIEAQQSMERDYARLRQYETRYRILFEATSDPLILVETATQKIIEANGAALRLFGPEIALQGRYVNDLVEARDGGAVQGLAAAARRSGKPEVTMAHAARGGALLRVTALPLRHDSGSLIVFGVDGAGGPAHEDSTLLDLVERASDAFVVTDLDGVIVAANPAFAALADLTGIEQAVGQSLSRWLGRPGVDFDVLTANLRRTDRIRLFATVLRPDYADPLDIELSAVRLRDGDHEAFGFVMRDVSRRLKSDGRGMDPPRSVEQLKELIGRATLKDLVRESTDMIERLCIQAALELTGDNRASAAEMLGLSRQSLYVKMRRHGMLDAAADDEDERG